MNKLTYPDFKGPAKRLEDIDLPRIGHEIGVGEDEVHMLIDVEAAGSGFDSVGRPKMLREGHYFYQLLSGAERERAVKDGLAWKSWGDKPYPKESYSWLEKAGKINLEAALKSCSWGAAQIMGKNHELAGYPTVFDMVNAMCEDEDNHIEAMIQFVKNSGIDDDLRRLAALDRPTTAADCAPIARIYNGSGYAQHNYHGRMAKAHNKWRGIADTPWSPESDSAPVIAPQIESEQLPKDVIRNVQQLLRDKGYVEVGKIDGLIGKDTTAAVTAFQIVEGLPATGKITHELVDVLTKAKMRPVSESRANATVQDVIKDAAPPVAESVQQVNVMKNIAMGLGGLSGLGALVDGGVPDLDKLANSINKTQMILGLIGDKLPWLIGLCAAGAAIYFGHRIISRQIEGFRKGTVR